MVLSGFSRLQNAFRKVLCSNSAVQRAPYVNSLRTIVYSESGAILERPERVSHGLLKVLTTVGGTVVTGGYCGYKLGLFLETRGYIYEPDDDD